MEDVSEVVGRSVLMIGDRQVILDNFGADDWSPFRAALIERKKKALIAAAKQAGDADPENASQWRRDALTEMATLEKKNLGRDDVVAELSSPEGAGLLLWCMLERRYPGQFKEAAIVKQIRTDEEFGSGAVGAMSSLLVAMGGGQESGNATSPSGAA